MQRIIVTGATSMIGVALIEECIKHGTEVYAVVRVRKAFPFAGKQSDQICGLFSGASGQAAGNDSAGM